MEVVATRRGLARVEADHLAILDTPYPDAGTVIRETGSLDVLRDCATSGQVAHESELDHLLHPLGRLGAIWGVGLNYRSKAELSGRPVPDSPILYVAAQSSAAGPGDDLVLPAERTHEMDYEGEIAVVIGRRLYQSQPEQVWANLAAITAANDVTARDVMKSTATPLLAKSFPGFSPLGASLRAIVEPECPSLSVRTWLNGELRQKDDSTGMIFSIPELLSRISWYCALEPGDVVLTGTPAGTGQDRGEYLRPGDVVTVVVDGVLPLSNRIVTTSESNRPMSYQQR